MGAHLEALATQELGLPVESDGSRLLPTIEFVRAAELTKEPQPLQWDIRGMFLRGTTVTLIGAPGTFKSVAAVDMAACIATGRDWHGRPTRQGAVFYLAGEGNAGLSRRLKAWEIVHGSLDEAPLFVSKGGIGLLDPLNAAAVGAEVERLAFAHKSKPVVVVIDTLARNFGAGDENSTADMSQFIENLDRHIREPFGCTINLAHHTGLGANDRARGSSALRAAVDTEILFERSGDTVALRCTKSKDAQPFETFAFETRGVELPWAGEDGLPETSFVLRPSATPGNASREKLGRNEDRLMGTLERMYDDHRDRLSNAGHDPNQALVRADDWRKECDMPKNRFYDAKASLERKDRIYMDHTHILIGPKP